MITPDQRPQNAKKRSEDHSLSIRRLVNLPFKCDEVDMATNNEHCMLRFGSRLAPDTSRTISTLKGRVIQHHAMAYSLILLTLAVLDISSQGPIHDLGSLWVLTTSH
jgi:hypothetical protein